jgi:hypothetical protein
MKKASELEREELIRIVADPEPSLPKHELSRRLLGPA